MKTLKTLIESNEDLKNDKNFDNILSFLEENKDLEVKDEDIKICERHIKELTTLIKEGKTEQLL